jgi:hypothetical protein
MNTDSENTPLFASESNIFRIASVAKIVSWIILVFYLISFVSNLSELISGQTNWPSQISQIPLAVANLFFAPAVGLFYFLVLQGVAQGLNLGLDIYYELQPIEVEDEEEEEEEEMEDSEL